MEHIANNKGNGNIYKKSKLIIKTKASLSNKFRLTTSQRNINNFNTDA